MPVFLLALWGSGLVRGDVVEFGCGYGTFTLPAARRTNGIVTALDIEAEMVREVTTKAAEQRRKNIRAKVRDFVANERGWQTGASITR